MKNKLEISKTDIIADLNYLLKFLVSVFPIDIIMKRCYNIDFYNIMQYYYKKAKDISDIRNFASLLSELFCALKCNHLWLNDCLYSYLKNNNTESPIKDYIKKSISSKAVYRTHLVFKDLIQHKTIPIPLFYYQNEYYIKYPLVLDKVFLSAGSKLISVNGLSSCELIAQYQDQLSLYDFQNKIFYSTFGNPETHYIGSNIYLLLESSRYKFIFEDHLQKKITLEYNNSSQGQSQCNIYKPRNSFHNFSKMVHYFSELKILYIRIPAMNLDDLNYYIENILIEGKKGIVKAVVFDIRNNPGGQSLLWINILKHIISNKMEYRTEYIVKNSYENKKYISIYSKLLKRLKKNNENISYDSFGNNLSLKKIPFLDNQEYLYFECNSTLVPDCNSLSLTVPMYIITQNIYSAAGCFTAFASSNNINIVGDDNPLPLGSCFDPMLVELPKSHLIFSITNTLDITNCKNLEDIFHTQINIPVILSLEEKVEYYNTDLGNSQNDKCQWLLTQDPYFRKVIYLLTQTE